MTENISFTPNTEIVEQPLSLWRVLANKLQHIKEKLLRAEAQKTFADHQIAAKHISKHRAELASVSDEELQIETQSLHNEIFLCLQDSSQNQSKNLEALEQKAFAVVREAIARFAQKEPYEIQTIGGLILADGAILEMKTGEGKTLTAIHALYTHALRGEGAHLVTSNEYLARRDGGLAGKILHPLGMRVGCIGKGNYSAIYDPNFVLPDIENELLAHWRPCTRQEAYAADITYGIPSEFGFDYLRDNTATDASQQVQRKLSFALIDEVDDILIDEARNPLILTEKSKDSKKIARMYTNVMKYLTDLTESTADKSEEPNGDFYIDQKTQSAILTEQGWHAFEQKVFEINTIDAKLLYGTKDTADTKHKDPDSLLFFISPILKALYVYKRDLHYLVQDNEVVLIDQSKGRTQPGVRYEDGLHEAIEAKEKVPIQPESITTATISAQLYFRMYEKLAGMTGTALSAADEFNRVYGLQVCDVPSNVQFKIQTGQLPLDEHVRQSQDGFETYYTHPDTPETAEYFERIDYPDIVTESAKDALQQAIVEIARVHSISRPILVGTATIEETKILSQMLTKENLSHQVLTAENNENEAELIAEAGRAGAITISTNMAGRGVDILLGGNPQQLALRAATDTLRFSSADYSHNALIQLVEACAQGNQIKIQAIQQMHPIFSDSITATIFVALQRTAKEHDYVRSIGGLHVVGIERRESRRIDDQLRGRAARQGDPGSSRFFVSLESPLFKQFGGTRIAKIIKRALLSSTNELLDAIQDKAEAAAKDARYTMLSYDLVLDTQRRAIYRIQEQLLHADAETIATFISKQTHLQSSSKINPVALQEHLSDETKLTKLKRKLLTIIHLEWQNFLAAERDFRRQIGTAGSGSAIDQFRRSTHAAFLEMQQDIANAVLAAVPKELFQNL